jgi:hypothetical protein
MSATFKPGQQLIDSAGRETKSASTVARVDTSRCVTAGDTEENRGCAWVAVVAPTRDDLNSIYAKQLAERYYLNGSDGGIGGMYGPVPDGAHVMPPGPVDSAPSSELTMDQYTKLSAVSAMSHEKKQFVCFFMVRRTNV